MAEETPQDLGPATRPTADDQREAGALFNMLEEVGDAEGPAVEVVHNAQLPWVMPGLIAMRDGTELRQKQLDGARGAVRWLTGGLRDGRTIRKPRPLTIPRLRSPIEIDGKLSADWNQNHATVTLNFDRTRELNESSSVLLGYDDDYLYGLAMIPDTSIVAPKLERDKDAYNYDCFEIFIYNPASREYWELNLSPTGTLSDAYNTKDLKTWGGKFRPERTLEGFKWAQAFIGTPNDPATADQIYGIEFAIPMRALPGGKLENLEIFLARVDRNETGETRLLGHVPFVAWFHNVWCYQPIKFE